MRTPVATPRIPGFPPPSAEPTPPTATSAPARRLDPRAGTKQLNVRVLTPLRDRYADLLRELEAAGFETTITEVVQAVLHDLADDPRRLRSLIRAWRRTVDPDPGED